MQQQSQPQFALCIQKGDAEDLEPRKVYQVLTDEGAVEAGYLRVIDESGEDYLYPQEYFVLIDLPQEVHYALLAERSVP